MAFIVLAAPKNADAFVFLGNGPCLSIFRAETGPISFLSSSGHFERYYSSDVPELECGHKNPGSLSVGTSRVDE
jgi:hypothetical protein